MSWVSNLEDKVVEMNTKLNNTEAVSRPYLYFVVFDFIFSHCLTCFQANIRREVGEYPPNRNGVKIMSFVDTGCLRRTWRAF